eukprot:maker-scaffold142_size315517-snap-gene-1.11 protein:Tk07698 transcript:maker-scaffold142_size315517-snap-gene-1.11-mRNA-1 annotation:"proteasome activator complex subunit 4-like"
MRPEFQRVNPYNVHLPYGTEAEADRYLKEIQAQLKEAVQTDEITERAVPAIENLHKYMILYGLRFTQADHVQLIQVTLEVLLLPNMSPLDLESVTKVLSTLLKKTYLLSRAELVLPWKPLFDLFYHWEDSSLATRGLVKPTQHFNSSLKTLLNFT